MHNRIMTAATDNPCFVLELALRIDSAGRKRLARDFDFARQLINATLGTALGRRTEMRQTPEWKAACAMPKGKERTVAFLEVSRSFGISSTYDFEKVLQQHANASGRTKQLGAHNKKRRKPATSVVGRNAPGIAFDVVCLNAVHNDTHDSRS